MQDVEKTTEYYNPRKVRKVLVVFDVMISDLIQNKKLNPIVTELFVRGRQLNISLIFIMQWYLKVPYDVILNSMHYFIIKISNKREPRQIGINHSSYIAFKDFMKIYKK